MVLVLDDSRPGAKQERSTWVPKY